MKIGGKRASLSALGIALAGIPGIEDGVFAFPPEAGGAGDESHPARRLAAFYVSGTLAVPQVLAALRERIDPVFLPRPIHRVASLPRNANGKLSQEALAGVFEDCEPAQVIAADHPALAGHFPGDPMVPGVLLLARVAEALRARYPQHLPGELRHARFAKPLRPGEPFVVAARREPGCARFEVRLAGRDGTKSAVIASGDWQLRDRGPEAPP